MPDTIDLPSMLLHRAQDHLVIARELAENPSSPEWGICLHVQQAAEKAIKAALSWRGVDLPRTHNTTALADLASEVGLRVPDDEGQLAVLAPVGMALCDDIGPTDDELAELPDRLALLGMAAAVVTWAGDQLKASH